MGIESEYQTSQDMEFVSARKNFFTLMMGRLVDYVHNNDYLFKLTESHNGYHTSAKYLSQFANVIIDKRRNTKDRYKHAFSYVDYLQNAKLFGESDVRDNINLMVIAVSVLANNICKNFSFILKDHSNQTEAFEVHTHKTSAITASFLFEVCSFNFKLNQQLLSGISDFQIIVELTKTTLSLDVCSYMFKQRVFYTSISKQHLQYY